MTTLLLKHGDCLVRMASMGHGSIDAVVCDPPYGLRFMGKAFDDLGDGARQQEWHAQWLRQAYRALKPGGVLGYSIESRLGAHFGGRETVPEKLTEGSYPPWLVPVRALARRTVRRQLFATLAWRGVFGPPEGGSVPSGGRIYLHLEVEMPILSMRAIKAAPHPHADRLRCYLFDAEDGNGPLQIVANLENVYEVGDLVAVALVGTVLEDGTEIKKGKYRGERSFGMAMGPTTKPVGTDLTADFNAMTRENVVDESTGVVEDSVWTRYTSIDGYLKLKADILAAPEVIVTEKSHGCFAAKTRIMLPNGEERSIQEVVADEGVTHVLSRDMDTGEFIPRLITTKVVRPNAGTKWVKLTLENGRTITCTEEHPFWSNDRNAWVSAKDLRADEDIASPND